MARAVIEIILYDDDENEMSTVNVSDAFSSIFIGDPVKAAVAADSFKNKITKITVTKLTSA